GHKTMVSATEFSALATVNDGLGDSRPGFLNKAGNCISFNTEFRHPPRVDYIICGNKKTNFFIDRYHHVLINFEQIINTFWCLVFDLFTRGTEAAEEAEVFTDVVILPAPLVAGNQYVHIGFGSIVKFDQACGSWPRHGDKNGDRNQRPNDFQFSAFVEVGGLNTARFAVHDHAVNHDPEHHHA